jgi:signal recognition particle subunit SRP54
MRQNAFTLEDFLSQMQQIKKMGPIKDIIGMIPGLGKMNVPDNEINEKAMAHVEAIINSMTVEERRNPGILNGSRKKRIAEGSGRNIQEVNRLLKQFEEMRKMMKSFTSPGFGKKGKKGMLPFFQYHGIKANFKGGDIW